MARRRDLVRSMQERTWERDLEPRKRMELTSASVDCGRGSVTPREEASFSMEVKCSWISASGALAFSKRRISLP